MSTIDERIKNIDPPLGGDRRNVLPTLLRVLRETKKGKRSGSEVARELGVWQSYVAKVEAGKTKVSDDYIEGLCKYLGLVEGWSTLLRGLNNEPQPKERDELIACCQQLNLTRLYLGPRATIPITHLHNYLQKTPMLVVSRMYIDIQLLYWRIKDVSQIAFFKSNPNPLVYTTSSEENFMLTYFLSSVASDYQLFDDALLVSDYLGYLQFDAGDRVALFIEHFDKMRQDLEPYYPES